MTASVPRGDSDRQPQPELTVGSLFTGIGGIDLAFAAAGFDVRWQVEIDPYCRAVLAKHAPRYWPNAEQHADIYDCHDLPHVDVVIAGFPCQPYSLLNQVRADDHARRDLVPEMFRVLKEVRPDAILFENVSNFTSIDGGRQAADFMQALTRLGYDAEWGHLYASSVGAPHYRKRWFCMAYAAGLGHQEPEAAPTRDYGRWDSPSPEPSGWAKRHALKSSDALLGAAAASRRLARSRQSSMDRHADGLSRRLAGHQFPAGQGIAPYAGEAPRFLPAKPLHWQQQMRAVGNAVVPQVILPLAAAVREFLDARAEEGGAE